MKKYLVLYLIFSFHSAFASNEVVDCENAVSTPDINYCEGLELAKAEQQMQRYLETSLSHNSFDQPLVDAIGQAQVKWLAYREAHCDAVYTMWREGSIRGLMSLSCQIKLTKQRSFDLWENYLTYMDSTPPVLEQP
ncbi:DUF1311 domain-containing protein [Alginatibacterium sediminis]|uniref:DUF1311 domain-containing protein n=1 Tax=Alginatibacterium sediminis TaxID=2164068 RepID=A0A420EBE4_9ALTE|nr:lysozyme inhibitor LprI family protein [Alginatibacterium sediminis]RKF17973.1 DUF1311 domain-containing protein [Alginatibacterium sediminis]